MLPSDVAAEFAPAYQSVQWSKEAIAELRSSFESFMERARGGVVTEFDSSTGENVQKLQFRESIPSVLNRKATEALTNARHAFDQAIFAARNCSSGPSKKSIYYPWAANPDDLKRLLERRGIDSRLW